MSGIYNEMQDGSYNELLSRRFNMKISSPASALVPEVGAGIVVENDRFEWGFIKRENHYSLNGGSAAVVGQKSWVRLSNLSFSAIAVLTSINLLGGNVRWGRSTILGALAGSDSPAQPSDFRNNQNSLVQCAFGAIVGGPVTGPLIGQQNVAGWRPLNIVIAPRSELVFWEVSDNVALNLAVTYYERTVSPSELV